MPKKLSAVLALTVSLLVLSQAAQAAPPAPRPYAGVGVLSLKEVERKAGEPPTVTLYLEPELVPVAELAAASMPRLCGTDAEPRLAASQTRGGWIRVYFDDAGRQGWLRSERNWEYLPWQEYLPGRTVRVLPGLRKGWYAVKSIPGDEGSELCLVARDQQVQVTEVRDDWALLKSPAGWFRWRDGDGRLTIALPSK